MLIIALAVGVALGVAAGQSDGGADGQPIASDDGKTRTDAEVILQLKYDKGELDRIYLTQFRKGKSPWHPSVGARTSLCADLCHSGLGGGSCGPSCPELMPVGLQSALKDHESNSTDTQFGEPRVSVCPTLCDNGLGLPLCGCAEHVAQDGGHVDWKAICTAFCVSDNYVLGGCPACEEVSTELPVYLSLSRVLNTNEGWVAWCNVQCRQGHGGAACNCDRTPFQ